MNDTAGIQDQCLLYFAKFPPAPSGGGDYWLSWGWAPMLDSAAPSGGARSTTPTPLCILRSFMAKYKD